MRVGHLDGKGIVYDDDGKPRLAGDERLLRHVIDDNMEVSEGSSFWNMKVLFPRTPEKGDLYLTDKRLVFLRAPNPARAFQAYNYPSGLGDGIADAYKARALNKAKALAYCEIELIEVEGLWVRKASMAALFLKSSPSITRKAILTRHGRNDDKFEVLRTLLQTRLSISKPEDKKGSYVLGAKYPFLHRRA